MHSKVHQSNTDKEISYYLASGGVWINCGIDPISEEMRVRGQEW